MKKHVSFSKGVLTVPLSMDLVKEGRGKGCVKKKNLKKKKKGKCVAPSIGDRKIAFNLPFKAFDSLKLCNQTLWIESLLCPSLAVWP